MKIIKYALNEYAQRDICSCRHYTVHERQNTKYMKFCRNIFYVYQGHNVK